MKHEYKYLVKLTTKDHDTIILAKSNDVKENNELARKTRKWLAEMKKDPELKDFAESTISVAVAPQGSCYYL